MDQRKIAKPWSYVLRSKAGPWVEAKIQLSASTVPMNATVVVPDAEGRDSATEQGK
jgi:hypothetical protein